MFFLPAQGFRRVFWILYTYMSSGSQVLCVQSLREFCVVCEDPCKNIRGHQNQRCIFFFRAFFYVIFFTYFLKKSEESYLARISESLGHANVIRARMWSIRAPIRLLEALVTFAKNLPPVFSCTGIFSVYRYAPLLPSLHRTLYSKFASNCPPQLLKF